MKNKIRGLFIKEFEAFRIMAAVSLAFIIIFVTVFIVSKEPGTVLYWFILGPSSSVRRFGNVIELMIPFLFCSLSACIMLQANKFNLSTDGAFYICGAIGSIIALNLDFGPVLTPAVVILVAAVAGAAITSIPAYLDVKFGANVVVSSIMLNYVLLYLGRYILMYIIKDPTLTYNASAFFPKHALLTRFIPKTRIHTGLFLVLILLVVIYLLIYKSKTGYEIRVTGQNESFARCSGINSVKAVLIAQLIGGLLAGAGGAVEVMGIYQQYRWDALLGYGFDGLLITVISKNNPKAILITAFLLAYLRTGADLVNTSTDIPLELITVLQALVVIFVAAQLLLAKVKHRALVKQFAETTGGGE